MFLDLLAPLLVGLVGSLHCLGMCGPLVVAYSLHLRPGKEEGSTAASAPWHQGLSHHAAFHLGRILTYGLLGALAAALFRLAGFSQFPLFSGMRSTLTLGAGVLMVLFGLVLLRVIPFSLFSLPSFGPGSPWARIFPPLLRSPGLPSKMALGMAAGFLPCMLSWAMVVKSATAPSVPAGFATMALFGLGTAPALLLTGLSASLLSLKARFLGERVAALSVMAMGLILILKGSKHFV